LMAEINHDYQTSTRYVAYGGDDKNRSQLLSYVCRDSFFSRHFRDSYSPTNI
ncbi:18191_t:CDS:2, partial [Entrophospora sp. SA101]